MAGRKKKERFYPEICFRKKKRPPLKLSFSQILIIILSVFIFSILTYYGVFAAILKHTGSVLETVSGTALKIAAVIIGICGITAVLLSFYYFRDGLVFPVIRFFITALVSAAGLTYIVFTLTDITGISMLDFFFASLLVYTVNMILAVLVFIAAVRIRCRGAPAVHETRKKT